MPHNIYTTTIMRAGKTLGFLMNETELNRYKDWLDGRQYSYHGVKLFTFLIAEKISPKQLLKFRRLADLEKAKELYNDLLEY